MQADMDQDHNAPPLNPLPWIVWVLALPLILIEASVQLKASGLIQGGAGINWRQQLYERLLLSPELVRHQWETGGYPVEELHRLVSYVLIHGSFSHALFAIVMLLALAKMVAEIFDWWAVVVVALGSALAGGLAYSFLVPGLRTPLIGAFPMVYGFIGAFTFLIFTNLARVGANKYRAFSLIGLLLFSQLLFGVLFGGGWDWVADIAGFTAGFLLSFVVSPGGFGRVLDRMRQR